MKIFISWSGERSMQIGKLIYDWLPVVHQHIKPYMSSEEIAKGTRWVSSVANELESSNFGLLCMTPETLTEPWIYFEAGALAKVVDHSRVAPILFQLKPSDIQGPLSQFQAVTLTDQQDMLRLLKSINEASGNESRDENYLEKAFMGLWGQLHEQINIIPETGSKTEPQAPTIATMQPAIEEILVLVRQQAQVIMSPEVRNSLRVQLQDQLVIMKRLLDFMQSESAWDDISEKWAKVLEAWATWSATLRANPNVDEEGLKALMESIIEFNDFLVKARGRLRPPTSRSELPGGNVLGAFRA